MGAAASHRRTFVNLSVVAGSATMLAVAWAGIADADGDRYDSAGTEPSTLYAAVPSQASITPGGLVPAPTAGGVSASAAPQVSPGMPSGSVQQAAPAPVRRVVVVRRSRAS